MTALSLLSDASARRGSQDCVPCSAEVAAVINCADNSGAKNLHMMASKRCGARLSRMPSASLGDMFLATVKKGKPELRKKVGGREPEA